MTCPDFLKVFGYRNVRPLSKISSVAFGQINRKGSSWIDKLRSGRVYFL